MKFVELKCSCCSRMYETDGISVKCDLCSECQIFTDHGGWVSGPNCPVVTAKESECMHDCPRRDRYKAALELIYRRLGDTVEASYRMEPELADIAGRALSPHLYDENGKFQYLPSSDRDRMIYLTGSKTSFKCECGCNVFKNVDGFKKYSCNACSANYIGE